MKKLFRNLGKALQQIPVIGLIFTPKPKIAVLRLSGVITDTSSRKATISYAKYEKIIEDAFETPKLEAVALVINSPGGSPAQSELVANHIRSLAEKHEKPIYAFVEDVAASGGYWIACAADKIYTAQTSIVGSIGVISASFGMQDLIEKYGIERRVHTSGKDKSFLDPFTPEKQADVKRLKSIQADLHKLFIDWVKSRRGKALTADDKDVFEGQFWTAAKAKSHGIIDGTGTMKTVCREKHGDDIKFIEFGPKKSWISSLFSSDLSLSRDALSTIEERSIWARYGL